MKVGIVLTVLRDFYAVTTVKVFFELIRRFTFTYGFLNYLAQFFFPRYAAVLHYLLLRRRSAVLAAFTEVRFGKSVLLADTISLVLHSNIIFGAELQFLPRERIDGVHDYVAMYGLRVGVGSDYALIVPEQFFRKFFGVLMRLQWTDVIFSRAR